MIRGTSSGADDVIGNGKCVLSGHLREAIWMIASKNITLFGGGQLFYHSIIYRKTIIVRAPVPLIQSVEAIFQQKNQGRRTRSIETWGSWG